jgi:hypothetical protein
MRLYRDTTKGKIPGYVLYAVIRLTTILLPVKAAVKRKKLHTIGMNRMGFALNAITNQRQTTNYVQFALRRKKKETKEETLK